MDEIEYLKKYLPKDKNMEEAIIRLKKGEPVQYIVGDVNFYGNIIKVDKNVLIPRPETEFLVEKTKELIEKIFNNKKISIIDIGTGSGCIAITLKKLFPSNIITASDISKEALNVAINNAKNNNVIINFIQSDIFNNIKDSYDCIISNPPYLTNDDFVMDIVKNNEPNIALYAKDNGLYFYNEIIKQSKEHLKDNYLIAFEIGENQKEEITKIAKYYYPDANIVAEKDLNNLDRYIFIFK